MSTPIVPDPDSARQLSLLDPIEIPLTKGFVAIIDPIDSDLASLKWHVTTAPRSITRYARHKEFPSREYLRLHRVILARILARPLLPGEQVDHIDGDGLNNRRSNLRLATVSMNQQNRSMQKNNTSGFKGVSFHKLTGKWQASIGINGALKYLGLHDTPEIAYAVYCEAARELHQDFANLGQSGKGE
jgi:HNH endonuclease